MEIVRNPDGTLIVPVEPGRQHGDDADAAANDSGAIESTSAPTTRTLHPGEGGYDEALGEWDRQQNPDADVPVSTASGREEAMSHFHGVAAPGAQRSNRSIRTPEVMDGSAEPQGQDQ